MASPLPIDPHLPAIVAAVREHRGAVVTAEPGAGKTTRVPRALLEAAGADGSILVLEPRRIAARMSAERVAAELGIPTGKRVGYITRFERSVSAETRLCFVTEGILSRRMLSDPTLRGVHTVVLDEFHERHVASDVGLALLSRLRQTSRPDLALVVMSATLDAAPVARFLGAPVVSSPGRTHEVAIEHQPKPDDRPLDSQVASALFDLLARGLDGHVLVFLPGAREIRACMETARKLAERHDIELLPLHGSLPAREQDRALAPSARRKVIFSTNVAETSVTIDGVAAVIDSGLANVASCSPWTGLHILKLSKVSQASAVQRAGRAGRTRAGVAVRLYTRGDFASRPAFDTPEIARVDLCEPVLELVAQGVEHPSDFAWFEPPPPAALASAIGLLRSLGAVLDRDAPQASALAVTPTGSRMLELPVHPRQARIVVEAERRGVSHDGCAMAAVIGERPPPSGLARAHRASDRSDLFALMDELDRLGDRWAGAGRSVAQLRRVARDRAARPATPAAFEDALLMSALAGYPDRVGRRRRADARAGRRTDEIIFASGGTAALSSESAVRDAELLVAIDVEDRVEGTTKRTNVRVASEVQADWLLELFTDQVVDEEVVVVSDSGRVEATRQLRLGTLVLDEQRLKDPDPRKRATALARAAKVKGLPLEAKEDLERLAVRVELVRGFSPAFGAAAFDAGDEDGMIERACEGKRTLTEVLETRFADELMHLLSPEQQRLLRTLAPERVELSSGRSLAIRYAKGAQPSVASRLQDFFGMARSPTILGGSRPLLLELLAPNQRAAQVTTDLAGFWERHYPAIAKELRRKYPRHAWPDDPLHAAPPAPKKRPT